MSFDNERFQMYLRFVEERHNIWRLRQLGEPPLWTGDPILASKKFTNVFRVLDPGSQFVFDLEHEDPATTLMRLFLYRHTGRTEAWRYLLTEFGEYPTVDTLDDVLESWKAYRGEFSLSVRGEENNPRAGRAGAIKRVSAKPIFTGAYLVFPQSQVPGTDKLESIIRLTQRLFGPEKLAEEFLQATDQKGRFAALRRHKGVADFMSMQILTDWGYTRFGTNEENDFIVPGPGARRGIQAITKAPNQVGFMRFAREELLAGDRCPTINLDDRGTVRYPSIMDVQNTFCEFSKYVRFVEAGKVSKPYIPAHPGPQATPVLPQHWTTTTR